MMNHRLALTVIGMTLLPAFSFGLDIELVTVGNPGNGGDPAPAY